MGLLGPISTRILVIQQLNHSKLFVSNEYMVNDYSKPSSTYLSSLQTFFSPRGIGLRPTTTVVPRGIIISSSSYSYIIKFF